LLNKNKFECVTRYQRYQVPLKLASLSSSLFLQ